MTCQWIAWVIDQWTRLYLEVLLSGSGPASCFRSDVHQLLRILEGLTTRTSSGGTRTTPIGKSNALAPPEDVTDKFWQVANNAAAAREDVERIRHFLSHQANLGNKTLVDKPKCVRLGKPHSTTSQ